MPNRESREVFLLDMAAGKNSFVLYSDLIEVVEELSDVDAGQLIKHILRYVNDLNPETENPSVKLAFIPVKQQLKRDLRKWESYIEKQVENGKKGGRPKKPKEPKKPKPFLENPTKPKKADTVTVTVTDNVTIKKEASLPKKHDYDLRRLDFQKEVFDYGASKSIPVNIIEDFFNYWSEPTTSGVKKMRWETMKTFSVPGRFSTWLKKEKEYGSKPGEKLTRQEQILKSIEDNELSRQTGAYPYQY